MAGFKAGLLVGTITGTLVTLFTSKKTGAQRQKDIADYVNGISNATEEVQLSVANVQKAASNLMKQVNSTLTPVVDGINDDVTDFSFQADSHLKAIDDIVTETQAKVAEQAPDLANMVAEEPTEDDQGDTQS